MRAVCRGDFRAVISSMIIAAVAPAALADDQIDAPKIRTVLASHSTDDAPSLPKSLEPPATAAAPNISPAVTALPESQQPKIPVGRLPFRRSNPSATTVMHAIPDPPVTNQTRQALSFYGGNPARQTLSQFPRRSPIQPGPARPMRQQIKPFNTVHRDPTISPYLNLYREENDTESAPNYYAFVRPQLEQIEANRVQQGEIQQLTRQLQGRSRTPSAPQYRATSTPGAKTPARYMDTAQFYGGWAR